MLGGPKTPKPQRQKEVSGKPLSNLKIQENSNLQAMEGLKLKFKKFIFEQAEVVNKLKSEITVLREENERLKKTQK